MPLVSTAIFADPDHYGASLHGAKIALVFTDQGDFNARTTSVELPNLRLLCSQERLSRIAFISLPTKRVFISLPTHFDAPPICAGIELKLGDIIFHGIGDCMHQRTYGPTNWAFISVEPAYLAKFGKVLTGSDLMAPPSGQILRPAANASRYLRSLLAKASRVAKTRAEVITHRECVRSLEQDFLHALVSCLTEGKTLDHRTARRHHTSIMARFEKVLAEHPDRQLPMGELCKAVDVPERTLRICCAEILGMGPSEYGRLRRLNLVRATLARNDVAKPKIAETAAGYGFTDPGRFAIAYRSVFGESPRTRSDAQRHPARICRICIAFLRTSLNKSLDHKCESGPK